MTPDQYRREGFQAGIEVAAEACADYPRIAPDELEWTHYDEQIAHSQACIRAIDVDEVLAKVGMPPPISTPKPVAWAESYDGGSFFHTVSLSKTKHHKYPLYLHPSPEAVGRLGEAMKHLHDIINCGNCSGSRQSARLALSALKGGYDDH